MHLEDVHHGKTLIAVVVGDFATEPYIVSHYQLLAHATVVKIYNTKYQETQKGKIGIEINSMIVPFFNANDMPHLFLLNSYKYLLF
ncbi:hypothetical protein AHAS_Ahas02G0110600 [Arachis hypogaea]